MGRDAPARPGGRHYESSVERGADAQSLSPLGRVYGSRQLGRARDLATHRERKLAVAPHRHLIILILSKSLSHWQKPVPTSDLDPGLRRKSEERVSHSTECPQIGREEVRGRWSDSCSRR